MPVEFKLPDLGEGIHEGEIIEVLVHVGDKVEDGQTVLIVETDKATAEVPSPVTGTVKEIRIKPGQTVRVGEVLMVFLKEGESGRRQRRRRLRRRCPGKIGKRKEREIRLKPLPEKRKKRAVKPGRPGPPSLPPKVRSPPRLPPAAWRANSA